MSGPPTLFSFLVHATAPDGSEKYTPGRRYELIVFVREYSIDGAKPAARTAISRAGWQFPEIKEVAQIDGKMKLSKARNLEEPMRTAARYGSSIVAFDKPIT
jgi:hypothetical protein